MMRQWHAGTPDLIHMLIHLLQLGFHEGAVHIKGVTHMIHTQVMPYQQVPTLCLPYAWHQVLQVTVMLGEGYVMLSCKRSLGLCDLQRSCSNPIKDSNLSDWLWCAKYCSNE